jgi:fibro-slime domain-containing protein
MLLSRPGGDAPLLAVVFALLACGCGAPVVTGAAPVPPATPGDGAAAADAHRPPVDGFAVPEAPPPPAPDSAAAACGQLLASVRDFKTSHPDFEKDALNVGVLFPGLVKGDLGADGKPVHAAASATRTTTGPASFDQWYRDVQGVNLRYQVPLPLTEQRPGLFVYDSAAFFPLDGRGWPGDERFGHNFSFTTEINTTFRYRGGERFTFTGDDDVFVFVNRKLALDLGGMHDKQTGTIDLDAQRAGLGIAPGGRYALDIFHAERHTTASNFRIETSIDCLVVSID